MPESTVLNIDCLTYMRTCKDKQFSLAVVDVPYGIGAAKEKPHNGWADWGIKQWDNESPNLEYFEQLFRITKNQIIWGANHFISKMPFDSSCWLIWDKGQRDFSLADGEMAWTSFNSSMRIFTYARAKAIQEGKIHPTQKPVDLYKWLLHNYAKQGDTIFDSHLGSQSSRIAAYDMGFDFTGCELDKDYFEQGCKRFENFKAQLKLF
jgi:site-specific DNA-methyltransferase (adenine-specific)